jgi:hypothetical protein
MLDYSGLWNLAKQQAAKRAALLCPPHKKQERQEVQSRIQLKLFLSYTLPSNKAG